ncbi:MAG: NAD(P)H-dependent oxidoreductase [Actinomycetes bacterium]
MNTSTSRIQVILGSTREGRAGERVARWVVDLGAQRDDIDVELVDLRDFPLPFFESAVPPKRRLADDPRIQAWAAKVAEADGYVFVTPEYNYGYPAVLKNALDHLYYEWNDKPVGFVGYGAVSGGLRAVMQLRQVVVELGLLQTHDQVTIPKVFAAFDDDGQPIDEMLPKLAGAMWDEMSEWAQLLQTKRNDALEASLASTSA